jgi:hypothetical protein
MSLDFILVYKDRFNNFYTNESAVFQMKLTPVILDIARISLFHLQPGME